MIRPEPIQDPWELEQLVNLYIELEPRRVLEIGTNNGGTLFYWARFAAPLTTVVSVDLGDRDQYKENASHFESWLAPGAELVTIVGNSHSPEVIAKMDVLCPYDFIFIDGDHSYEGVKEDWDVARYLSAQNAVIAFHDIICKRTPEDDEIYGPCEARILWQEIKAKGYRTEEFLAGDHATYPTPDNPERLGIGVVYLGSGWSA